MASTVKVPSGVSTDIADKMPLMKSTAGEKSFMREDIVEMTSTFNQSIHQFNGVNVNLTQNKGSRRSPYSNLFTLNEYVGRFLHQ